MKKIGIYGGTFDPPHNAHIAVARAVLDAGLADEVWLMVSPLNPLKSPGSISPDALRLEMAHIAADGIPGLRVSDFEFSLPRPSYTVNTLRTLSARYPDCRFTLIAGGDNLSNFSRWRNAGEILRDYGAIIYPRPGCVLPESLPEGVTLLGGVDLSDISSTEVRRRAAAGESLGGLVSPQVEDFIRHNALYGTSGVI